MKKIIVGIVIAGGLIMTSCNVSREGGNYDNANNERAAANPNSDDERVSSSVSPRAERENAYPQGLGSYNHVLMYDTVLGPTTGRNYNNRRGAKENFYEQAGDEKVTVY